MKQNDIESKYVQWQQDYNDNHCQLKQRVEWCQFLDDKYKVGTNERKRIVNDIDRYDSRLSMKLIHFVKKSTNEHE
jgi:hypothetical protein